MRNKFFNAFIAGFFLVSVFVSCNKTEVDTSVYVDSYINSIIEIGVTKYAVMHSAYSFVELSSVGVKGTGGTSVPLANFSDQGFSFYTPAGTATYTTNVPAADSYTYDVLYESGETAIRTNATSGKSLIPAQELKATKSPTDIVLTWKPVVGTEAYKIRIFTEDPVTLKSILIYESGYLVPKDAVSDLSVPFSLVSMSPYLSNTLTLDVSAFIFEQGKETFQAVSIATVKGYFGN